MRGFTMVLFLGAAIALPISKAGLGAENLVTSSSWSPEVLEHRAMDAIAAPLNSWSMSSVAKRVAAIVQPRIVKDAGSRTPEIDGSLSENARQFWGPRHMDLTPSDAEKGIAATSDNPPIQARNSQGPTFARPAHVDDTPADSESQTPKIDGSLSENARQFWGPRHVDLTPSDAEMGTATASHTSQIQARSLQSQTFSGPAYVDDTPADAESHTPKIDDSLSDNARQFWGPRHVDLTPSDAEEGIATTSDTPPIQTPKIDGSLSDNARQFWGPRHVDLTPSDAKEGTVTTFHPSQIQARSPQSRGPAHVDDTPTDANGHLSENARQFWGPRHVDLTPSDAEGSVGSLNNGGASPENGQNKATSTRGHVGAVPTATKVIKKSWAA